MRAKACWIVGVGMAEIREQALPNRGPDQVLVQTLYSAISRGTEQLVFLNQVPASEALRMRAPHQEGEFPGPVKYGYINVGRVLEGPPDLQGRMVFTLFPHQTHFVVDRSAVSLVPGHIPASRAILAAGMETAINALWDAEAKVGDRIVVVGAGVIGSLCAYLAAKLPGTRVQLVDSNPERASLAASLGCEFARPEDMAGDADLVFHASGSSTGLASALSAAGPEATIVELSWYGNAQVTLPLGEAFHSRRLQLRSSQVGGIPASQRARWDYSRRLGLALELLADEGLETLISGESDFADLPEALANYCKSPGTLCHRISYPQNNT